MRPWSVVILLTLVAPSSALAYEVKKTSSGAELHWSEDAVVFAPAFDGGPVAAAAAMPELEAALATWQTALGGARTVAVGDPVAPGVHTADGVNTVRWATDAKDPDIEKGVLALTFISYRADTGAIGDADVVLNAVNFQWTPTMTGCSNKYDLQSALTHELGHALGLAHSVGHTDATMFATSDECDAGKRDLAKDDQDAIAHLYEQEPSSGGGCAAGGSPGLGMALVLALLFPLLLARRRAPAIALAAVVAATGAAEASQLRRLALDELAQSSTIVVRGHVVGEAVTPRGPIATIASLVVDDCLGGACPATLEVVRRGGVRGTQGMWVDAEAAPVAGTAVVLYLRRASDGTYRVVGGVQGMFRVVGERAVRDLRGHQLLAERMWDRGGVEIVELATLRAHAACSPAAP